LIKKRNKNDGGSGINGETSITYSHSGSKEAAGGDACSGDCL